jgi:hypothetical protein
MTDATVSTGSSADARGKEKFEALLQRGASFVSSHVSPLFLAGVSGALVAMGSMGLANKLKETFFPSAERLVNGDKGMTACYHFVHFVRCSFSSSSHLYNASL